MNENGTTKKLESKWGKKGETAQRGWIKPWVIAGQDWTAAPQRFGHGSYKDKRAEETLDSCKAAAGRHTSPPLASMDEPGNGGRYRYADQWINSPQRRGWRRREKKTQKERKTSILLAIKTNKQTVFESESDVCATSGRENLTWNPLQLFSLRVKQHKQLQNTLLWASI